MIESSGGSWGPVVDGSDGIVAVLGLLGGCAVYWIAKNATVGVVVMRIGGYAGVVHSVGDVGQSAVVAGIMLDPTA